MTNEVDRLVVVAGHEQVADGVVLVTLRDPNGQSLPAWEAGAHIDVVCGPEVVRQYSLCSSPTDLSSYGIAVLREVDGKGSHFIHDVLHPGSEVVIRGPRNHFELVPSKHYLFIAGGIGITPMLPMIEQAHASGADWSLVYGGHAEDAMAFCDRLAKYGERVTLVPRNATDRTLRHRLPDLLGHPHPGTLVYCCGPEGLLDAVEELCQHWPRGSLHMERFSAKKIVDGVENHAFEIVLTRSGLTLQVPPDRTIVEVVQDHGISVLTSCRDGVCGTCETIVLEGEIDHRDSVLNAEERETAESMMVCVSRCKGERLVLDL